MASNKGYTTAAKVQDALAGKFNFYFTSAMIDNMINRMEGVIDVKLGVGADTGDITFTWATGTPKHWVVEGAATYGAALMLIGVSPASWNTLSEIINAQNVITYMLAFFMNVLEDEQFGDRVLVP